MPFGQSFVGPHPTERLDALDEPEFAPVAIKLLPQWRTGCRVVASAEVDNFLGAHHGAPRHQRGNSLVLPHGGVHLDTNPSPTLNKRRSNRPIRGASEDTAARAAPWRGICSKSCREFEVTGRPPTRDLAFEASRTALPRAAPMIHQDPSAQPQRKGTLNLPSALEKILDHFHQRLSFGLREGAYLKPDNRPALPVGRQFSRHFSRFRNRQSRRC